MTELKKILHIFPSFEIGGSQRRFATLANENREEHVKHHVFALDGRYDAMALIEGLTVAPLSDHSFPKTSPLAGIKAAKKTLKSMQPDLLVTYNWGSVEWALANCFSHICPMVHVQDGFGTEEQKAEKFIRKKTRAYAYKRADAVVVPSKTLETIAQTSWHIPDKKLHYIPNGIDIKRFNRKADMDALANFGLSPPTKIIGTVAALRPEKNIGRLIEAYAMMAQEFPDSRLVIIGDGIGRSALQMLAERIGLKSHVIFTGALSEPERIIPAFNIFALSSDTEQMPISVVEAMAAGLPVVSTDVGDISTMVCPDNAPFIKGHDAETLANNLMYFMDSPQQAEQIGTQNHAKAVKDYTQTRMIGAYKELFSNLMR